MSRCHVCRRSYANKKRLWLIPFKAPAVFTLLAAEEGFYFLLHFAVLLQDPLLKIEKSKLKALVPVAFTLGKLVLQVGSP